MVGSIAAVVLAAGAGSRFGGSKLMAALDGRPLVAHVLAVARAAGLDPLVIVVPPEAQDLIEVAGRAGAEVVVNARPADGLSSSVRIGLATVAARPDVVAAAILPGDQPRVRPEVLGALVAAASADASSLAAAGAEPRPLVAPRYAGDGAPNPVIVRRPGFGLARELTGDRGFGPLIAARPELVEWVAVDGANPDVDTPADLARLVEATWAERVRGNREQVDRVREVPDGADFYGPVTGLFRADPRRTDDPVAEALRELAVPGETWLDVGAGAGRYALPLALALAPGGSVVAVDPSVGMLAALREQMAEHGIANVRPLDGRWPPDDRLGGELGPLPSADVALIAHVGYDIEAIGPFVDALEAAARRLVVAVLMERQPATLADPFWPPIHGEARVGLPALAEFLELLAARGVEPTVERLERDGRTFRDRDELLGFLRRQLWTLPGGHKDRRLEAELDARIVRLPAGGVALPDERGSIGIVTWAPPTLSG